MIRGAVNPKIEEFSIPVDLHNKFLVEVIDARTGNPRLKAQAKNVICNQLWSKYFLLSSWNAYIHYGSGQGTPSASDTSLFTYVGGAASSFYAEKFDDDGCWCSFTTKIQLSESTAVGKTLTEVGIAASSGSTTLCTHAMLKDMNGNPISIDKTDTDIINIYATVFVHWGEIPGVRLFNRWRGSSARNTGWAAVAGFGKTLVSKALFQKGIYGVRDPSTSRSFTQTVKNGKVTLSFTRVAVAEENNGGLVHLVLHAATGKSYKPWAVVSFPSEQVSASRISGESIGTGDGSTTDFNTAFSYAEDVTLYVDGVQNDEVEIFSGYPKKGLVAGYALEELKLPGYDNPGAVGLWNGLSGDTSKDQVYLFYNPNHDAGIGSINGWAIQVDVSDDLSTWTTVATCSAGAESTKTIAEEYQHAKYWRVTMLAGGRWTAIYNPSSYTGKNIHFGTPPPVGSVITADYTPRCIAKDANHVFDISVTFDFGEYTEAQ